MLLKSRYQEKYPVEFKIPYPLKQEHEELHNMLRKATQESGEIGDAAKLVAKLMHPHFIKEEEYALPPLGLLHDLAQGKVTPDMEEVLGLTDRLKSDLGQMLEEHKSIVAALEKLSAAAKKAKKMEYVEFARVLTLHAQTEEEVSYPTAILIGEYIREKLRLAPRAETIRNERDMSHQDWKPKSDTVLHDQRAAYDEMRERCPVAHSEFLGWSLFRHEDIATVLDNPETYSNISKFQAIPNGMDPPVHGRYRDALAANFDEKQMAMLEPRVREIATNLLAPIFSSGEVEFIDAFATPFALKTLCVLLGWPEHQWECLSGWTHGSQQAAFSGDQAAGKALAKLFSEHVKANLDAHRSAPGDVANATDSLLSTDVGGERFDDDQIVSILRNWTAGHGTVVDGLGILVLHLSQELELQDRLRNDPSLIPAAIEEILRVDGPLVANRRTTTREVEIQGKTIPKGENLTLMWIAANRDPRAFDDPNVVKIERNTGASMVWGQGIHICQGAPLGRLEMRVALEELLSRTQHFELTDDAQYRTVYPSNGLTKLPLRVSRSFAKSGPE